MQPPHTPTPHTLSLLLAHFLTFFCHIYSHTHTHTHIHAHTLSQTHTHTHSHGHTHVQDPNTDGTLTVLSSLNNQPLCARENVMFLVDICAATMSLLIKMSTSSSRSRSLSYRESKCSPYSFQGHGTKLRRRRKKSQ